MCKEVCVSSGKYPPGYKVPKCPVVPLFPAVTLYPQSPSHSLTNCRQEILVKQTDGNWKSLKESDGLGVWISMNSSCKPGSEPGWISSCRVKSSVFSIVTK